MDWEYLDRQLIKVNHKKTISVVDKKMVRMLKKIIKLRYPYFRQEGIRKAIELTFESMYQPYWREEFLQRLAEKFNQVPYKMLVGKIKKQKT